MMMKPDVKKMFTGLAQLSVCPSQYFGNMNARKFELNLLPPTLLA